ncbi:recombinase, partial [Raoultella planticola]
KIGVSIVTNGIKNAMASDTRISSLQADNMIIHRQDKDWIEHRLPDDKLRKAFSEAFAEKERILINRVIDALDRFTGFTHVMCVGGGAKLISEAVKKATNVPSDRFYTSKEPQFDLVLGMLEMKEGSANE